MTVRISDILAEKDESPQEGDFIGAPDINRKIHEILEVNEDDYDEQILELSRLCFGEAGKNFNKKENGSIIKRFKDGKYIRLNNIGSITIIIDMIQMPTDGVQAMLEVITYCIDNGYLRIEGKVQPQKNSSERRKKILMDFYINFGFSNKDGTNIELTFTEENKKVLRNKIKYYLENGKWFTS